VTVVTAQAVGAAGRATTYRARKTTIDIGLSAPLVAVAGDFDSSTARQSLTQTTLTRLGIGLTTVRVRLHRQWPRRTLFRIHCLSRKPGQSSIRSSVLTAIGDNHVDCTGPI
jgi:hypothetical protein